jgi:hypothetical protein
MIRKSSATKLELRSSRAAAMLFSKPSTGAAWRFFRSLDLI